MEGRQVPNIEIFVPFVSGADLLVEAVKSVQDQTYRDWNLTVVDNAGPEPEASARIQTLADERILYTRFSEHIGMAENWNRCLSLATAQHVILLHADDVWGPTFLEEIVRLIDHYPNAAAFFTAGHTIDGSGAKIFSLADWYKHKLLGKGIGDVVLTGDKGLAHLVRGNFLFASAICFRRSVLSTDAYDSRLRFTPDFELMTRLLHSGATIVGSRADATRYRRHTGQTTLQLTRDSQRFDEELGLYQELTTRSKAIGWTQSERAARHHTSLRLNLGVHALKAMAHCDLKAGWTYLTAAAHWPF